MIKIPGVRFTTATAPARNKLYNEIEDCLRAALGNSIGKAADGSPYRRWSMSEWSRRIDVTADEKMELFLALKYGVTND